MILSVLQTTNLALRLALELGALAAVSYWGFHLGYSRAVRILAGIGAPLATATIWALFASPHTDITVADPLKVALQLTVFAVAAGALLRVGRSRMAVVFAGVAVVNAALIALWGQ